MATPVTVNVYRPGTVATVYEALTYADAIAYFPTILEGDTVKVLSTGIVYKATAQETLIPMSDPRFSNRGFFTNFRDLVGEPLADTDNNLLLTSGFTVMGQGIAETDSGMTVANAAAGPIATLTTTDEVSHTIGLAVGGTTEMWDPATYGPMEIEAEVAMSSAITLRQFFIGFIGAYADALDPVVTGSGTTLTLVLDDVSGLFFDVGLTATSRFYAPHNKADEAATILTTASGVDTGVNCSAAGTYMRLKVRIEADGRMRCWIDGVQVTDIAAAASTSVKLNPVIYLGSTSTAVKSMLIKNVSVVSHG